MAKVFLEGYKGVKRNRSSPDHSERSSRIGGNLRRSGRWPFLQRLTHSRIETEQKLKEKQGQLILTKKGAEAAAAAKSVFLSNISAELRTPLHAPIGLSEMLSETPLDLEQTELVSTIQSIGRLQLLC